MRFVAIDLETTGLSPETDTIIEVAAIAFEVEFVDGAFRVKKGSERSMLIDPKRELSEEVSMITGITGAMLDGRETWDSVRERVAEFIGTESIIVGHNVLFDIAMLRTHGIDLSQQRIIDTFELSEIFSQDAESLNLLFLAKKYNLPIDGEHRALDDTRLSVGLFIHYLHAIQKMGNRECAIWKYLENKDLSGTLSTLRTITGIDTQDDYTFSSNTQYISHKIDIHTFHTESRCSIQSFFPGEEIDKILTPLGTIEEKTLIVTQSKRETSKWSSIFESIGIIPFHCISENRYCSWDALSESISKENLSRKEIIFFMKILFWKEKTKTGLIEELKYYGEEYTYIEKLRCEASEFTPERRQYESDGEKSLLHISECSNPTIHTKPHNGYTRLIVLDMISLDDELRKYYSKRISLRDIFSWAQKLYHESVISLDFYETILLGASYFQSAIESTPNRPSGPSPVPPGDFGETYYISQGDLWHRGEKWLSLSIGPLSERIHTIEKQNIGFPSIDLRKIFHKIINALREISRVSSIRDDNMSIILQITEQDTDITIMPRKIDSYLDRFLKGGANMYSFMGYGIDGKKSMRFIREQLGIEAPIQSTDSKRKKILQTGGDISQIIHKSKKTIILGTSNKQLRQITQDIQKKFEKKIFTQGLSGGKGKMKTLYEKEREEKVLLGLIDTWSDEYTIWSECDTLIIPKMPFDPPTDPYYLGRTVGMKNNFEEYSCPLSIHIMNTLIGRAKFSHPEIDIYCLDPRLTETVWGGEILSELL